MPYRRQFPIILSQNLTELLSRMNFKLSSENADTSYSWRIACATASVRTGRTNRERIIHWGPRTLDLDILFMIRKLLIMPDLHIPHIRSAQPRFRSCTNESDCSVSATSCIKSDHFAASGQPSETNLKILQK